MRGDESWSSVSGHDEDIGFIRVSKGHVTVCVENFVIMEYVVCGNESIQLEIIV
jgi:hypothetical protein